MRLSSRFTTVLAALAIATVGTFVSAPGTSLGSGVASRGAGLSSSRTTADLQRAHDASAVLAPTCSTVPTSLVAAALGMSIVSTGPHPSTAVLFFFGKNVLVGGKKVVATWLECGYQHPPATIVSPGVSISYLDAPTAARALAITKAMCGVMKPDSTNYTTPALGQYSCIQGHTGPMQSANGIEAEKNIVVMLFGSQSPAQTLTLEKGITPLVAKAVAAVAKIQIATTVFSASVGYILVGISCAIARCTGEAQITLVGSPGTVIAKAPYQMNAPSSMFLNVTLTPAGSALLDENPSSSLQASLSLTVSGGDTVTKEIVIQPSPPTSSTSTTTSTPTTTTPMSTTSTLPTTTTPVTTIE